MSSYKLWRDKGQLCDKTSNTCSPSRKPPSLLRLDSTGQVSSVQTTSGQTSNMCHGKKGRCYTCKRPKMSLCQSVVNGLSMSSMIDTASSYFNTASSYIESIYPYKTSKCLVKSSTNNNKMEFDMFDSGYSMSAAPKGREGSWTSGVGNCTSKRDSQVPQGLKKTWTHEILGAIHSTVFNKEMAHKPVKPERYIPPPVKHRQLQEKRCCAVLKDPKLTPYNAKLLEKSKRKDTNTSRNVELNTCHKISVSDAQCHLKDKETNNDINGNQSSAKNAAEKDDIDVKGRNLIKDVPNKIDATAMQLGKSQKEVISDSSVTDWFEYESKLDNLIPCKVNEQLERDSKNLNDNVLDLIPDPTSDCTDRMLHSWYSMDNDSEVKKSNSAQNIPISCSSSQTACDMVELSDSPSNSGNKHDSDESCFTDTASINNSESITESRNEIAAKIGNAFKKQQEENGKKNRLVSVLYIRNGASSKRRPSAQKRIRHKTQKNPGDLNSCSSTDDIKSPKTLKEGKTVHPNSSVAFILGLDNDQTDCFSIEVNCDIEDLDWSSSDENDSDCQFDDIQDCDDFDLFSPLKNLMNFQVRCSVESILSPATSSYQECSPLDKINLEWEMNVSVKESEIQKKITSKKVHFKDGKDLIKVHPIVAWSYAYQAARKGPWEEIARDRGRFQRRITDGEKLLKPILETCHRNAIFEERFQSLD